MSAFAAEHIPKKHNDLIEFVENELGIVTDIKETPNDVAKESDILIEATLTTTPLVETTSIKPGSLVIGLNHSPKAQVFQHDLLEKSKIYIDHSASIHAGTIQKAVDANVISKENIVAELSEVVTNTDENFVNENEFIYFHSSGVSIEDLATAISVYNSIVADAEFDFS